MKRNFKDDLGWLLAGLIVLSLFAAIFIGVWAVVDRFWVALLIYPFVLIPMLPLLEVVMMLLATAISIFDSLIVLLNALLDGIIALLKWCIRRLMVKPPERIT